MGVVRAHWDILHVLTWYRDSGCCSLVHRSINRDIHPHITLIGVHPWGRLGHCQSAGDIGGGVSDPGGLCHDKCGPPSDSHTTAVEGNGRTVVAITPAPGEHKRQRDRGRLGGSTVDLEGAVWR